MRAVGNHVVVERTRKTSSGGIVSQYGNIGMVVSCATDPSINGCLVLLHGRKKYEAHKDYIFVPYEDIFCVLEEVEE